VLYWRHNICPQSTSIQRAANQKKLPCSVDNRAGFDIAYLVRKKQAGHQKISVDYLYLHRMKYYAGVCISGAQLFLMQIL